MILNDIFWRNYELDLAEIKISYLNWAIGYAREPPEQYRHLFLWPEQTEYCIVNSRSFAISPFGPGVRGMPRVFRKPIPRGLDEIDMALMKRLTTNTRLIREALRECLSKKDISQARHILLNFYWLKLGPHELLFDHIQFDRGGDSSDSQGWKKGRWGFDESENWTTLTGIRNRVVNVIRYRRYSVYMSLQGTKGSPVIQHHCDSPRQRLSLGQPDLVCKQQSSVNAKKMLYQNLGNVRQKVHVQ